MEDIYDFRNILSRWEINVFCGRKIFRSHFEEIQLLRDGSVSCMARFNCEESIWSGSWRNTKVQDRKGHTEMEEHVEPHFERRILWYTIGLEESDKCYVNMRLINVKYLDSGKLSRWYVKRDESHTVILELSHNYWYRYRYRYRRRSPSLPGECNVLIQ